MRTQEDAAVVLARELAQSSDRSAAANSVALRRTSSKVRLASPAARSVRAPSKRLAQSNRGRQFAPRLGGVLA